MIQKTAAILLISLSTSANLTTAAAQPMATVHAVKDISCVICQDSTKTTLACGHTFDTACIAQWLQTKANCPSCRALVSLEEKKELQPVLLRSQPGAREPRVYVHTDGRIIDIENREQFTRFLNEKNPSPWLIFFKLGSVVLACRLTKTLVTHLKKGDAHKALQTATALYALPHFYQGISLQKYNCVMNILIKLVTRSKITSNSNHTLPLCTLATTAIVNALLMYQKQNKAHNPRLHMPWITGRFFHNLC